MNYDLIVSDFDYTLGKAPDVIEESTVAAIKEYEKKGGIFCICTGRMMCSISAICLKYGFKGETIAFQGSMIKSMGNDELEFLGGIEPPLAAEIVLAVAAENYNCLFEIDDRLYYVKKDVYSDVYEKNCAVSGEVIENPKEFITAMNRKVQKILCVGVSKENIADFIRRYSERFSGRIIVNSGAPYLVEFVDPYCTKGEAVKFLAKKFNVPMERVMTVGDSLNDMTLITCGAHGVAVGSACEELKAAAKEVTVPFAEKPVEYLIKKYCL